jgi:hypothetical protein
MAGWLGGMGGGWLGGGWQGGGWQGGGWQGGGWQGGGWAGAGPTGLLVTRDDKPFMDLDVRTEFDANLKHLGRPDYANSAVKVASIDAKYPDHRWDADLYALSILPEFFGVANWTNLIVVDPPNPVLTQPDRDKLKTEIERLLILAVTERSEAMGEILQQHQNFQVVWLQMMMIDEKSNPATFLLMKLAARVGEAVMIYYKRKWSRARPSQICPSLCPPVPVPGHAAYPAGHALLAYLTTNCLLDLMPAGDAKKLKEKTLIELARRVALNREIAGLHYTSDSEAGKTIADQLLPILMLCPTYTAVRTEAVKEWTPLP